MSRVETGPVQFGDDDWPGIFIRGDQALYFAGMLRLVLEDPLNGFDMIERVALHGLIDALESCRVPVEKELTKADARTFPVTST